MKRLQLSTRLFFLGVLLVSLFASQAQNKRTGRISLEPGWSGDFFDEMTIEQIISRSSEYQLNAIDLDGYTFSYAYREVSAASVGFAYYLGTRDLKGEWKIGVNAIFDREPLITYQINNLTDPDYKSIGFGIIESEVNLNLAYLREFPISKRFSAHLGPQVSMGTTFDDEFVLVEDEATGSVINGAPVMENTTTYFDANSTRLIRLGVNSGINYHFKNESWSIGLNGFLSRGKQQLRNYEDQNFTSARVFASLSYKIR